MGEAKRRKEQGLAPRSPKKESKSKFLNIFTKYPRLPLYLGVFLAVYLIFDWIRLNSPG